MTGTRTYDDLSSYNITLILYETKLTSSMQIKCSVIQDAIRFRSVVFPTFRTSASENCDDSICFCARPLSSSSREPV